MVDEHSRFLVFRGASRGQGIGASMHGLATALTLATKFGRRVCVSWRAFEHAFEPLHEACPDKEAYFTVGETTGLMDASSTFELWSFGGSTAEKEVFNILASNRSVVLMHGDGGAAARGGRGHAPLDFPARPRPELYALLPSPRRLVVHLRAGDPGELKSRGLFTAPHEQAIMLLAEVLPADSYVLADSERVLEALCPRLACPAWGALAHSVARDLWGGRRMDRADGRRHAALQTLQTWADWWTIRTATHHVLHTPSSFSESALRFSLAAGCVLAHDKLFRTFSYQTKEVTY
jgi:hypothetical protein